MTFMGEKKTNESGTVETTRLNVKNEGLWRIGMLIVVKEHSKTGKTDERRIEQKTKSFIGTPARQERPKICTNDNGHIIN